MKGLTLFLWSLDGKSRISIHGYKVGQYVKNVPDYAAARGKGKEISNFKSALYDFHAHYNGNTNVHVIIVHSPIPQRGRERGDEEMDRSDERERGRGDEEMDRSDERERGGDEEMDRSDEREGGAEFLQ